MISESDPVSTDKVFDKIMDKYELLSIKGEGAYSKVYKAKCLETGQEVAIKHMNDIFKSYQGARRVIREISILR